MSKKLIIDLSEDERIAGIFITSTYNDNDLHVIFRIGLDLKISFKYHYIGEKYWHLKFININEVKIFIKNLIENKENIKDKYLLNGEGVLWNGVYECCYYDE